MGKRLDLALMNAPVIKDLKEKGFARIEGKDADIMSLNYHYILKGIEPIMIYRIWIKYKHQI